MTDRPTPDPITRLNAALEGRYRIERELGAGGMATVYLADDLRHNRKVAIKVLRPELAAVLGAERFLGEIETTANLQHPHILPLFDSGEADRFLFFVMPYIEGETLRDRLDRDKQLPVDEAVGIARSVAAALVVAHEQGVIHRDLKPANILLSRGEPLLADFGIALAVTQAGGGRLTETGLSVGTPYYMSPEQATGDRDVNASSDVYALGCVLYEMLTGEPPYVGNTAQAVLGKILTEKPRAPTRVRASVPPNVNGAVMRALEKLPADRFTSASSFIQALESPSFRYGEDADDELATSGVRGAGAGGSGAGRGSGSSRWRSALPWGIAAGAVLLAGWALGRTPTAPEPASTFYLQPEEPDSLWTPKVSPDGSMFAVTGRVDGESVILVRSLGEERFRPLPETQGGGNPAFSPDGRWIVFSVQGESSRQAALKRISVNGGSPNTLVQEQGLTPSEAHWGDAGSIVFYGYGSRGEGIYLVPEAGGEPELVLENSGWAYHPRLLPGGHAIMMTDGRNQSTQLLDLRTDSLYPVLEEAVETHYVPTGHLVFVHPSGGIQAVPFDLESLSVTGPPVPVRDGPEKARTVAPFSVSDNGVLVYISGREAGAFGANSELVEVDLETGVEAVDPLRPRRILDARYSPDGRHVAFATGENFDQTNIFLYDLELGTTPRQLTFDGFNRTPVWSPDGSRVAFASTLAGGALSLIIRGTQDDSSPQSVPDLNGEVWPSDWPEEDLLLMEFDPAGGPDGDGLYLVNPEAPDDLRSYLVLEGSVQRPRVSPDGRHVAYVSQEAGDTREVFVRRFPEPGQPSRVSFGGGGFPIWSPDGGTLYYARGPGDNDTIYAARVRTDPSFAVLETEPVWTGSAGGYDVHPSGDGLLVVRPTDDGSDSGGDEANDEEPERFVVVLNWFQELRERMGEAN